MINPSAVRSFGIVAAVVAAFAVHGPVASAASSTPSPTINVAALGSGGGQFCDVVRKSLIDTVRSDIASAVASHDTAKIKAYYEKLTSQTAKMISVAPAGLKDALNLTRKRSDVIGAAMKKANYDLAKVDRTVFNTLGATNPAETAAQAKIAGYTRNTCHIDINKALGTPGLTASATVTTKGK